MLIDDIIDYTFWGEENGVYEFRNVIMKKDLDPYKVGDNLEFVIVNLISNSVFFHEQEFKRPTIYKLNFSLEK